ncbi:hypothetical protein J6590_087563 [Homalodisca vitripennis]|nr:hypothetical protein J6590_087563 [Homalodisca vitripennis]
MSDISSDEDLECQPNPPLSKKRPKHGRLREVVKKINLQSRETENYKDRSSDLRELVGEPMSSDEEGQEFDFEIAAGTEANFSDSSLDFLSDSDDEYVPNSDEINEFNVEQNVENILQAPCRPNLNTRPRAESPNLFDIPGPSSRPDPQDTDPITSVWLSVFPLNL